MKLAHRLTALAFGAVIAVPSIANAACQQSDFVGTWTAYITTTRGSQTTVAVCFFEIRAGSPKVVREGRCGGSAGDFRISNAHLEMTNNNWCFFGGIATVTHVQSGVSDRYTVHAGTLAQDKITGFGVGELQGGGVFSFDMTKRGGTRARGAQALPRYLPN